MLDPAFGKVVLPVTLGLVVLLFAVQRFGTNRIGEMFDPVMLVWFATIGVLGARRVIAEPSILAAANPAYAVSFFLADPSAARCSRRRSTTCCWWRWWHWCSASARRPRWRRRSASR